MFRSISKVAQGLAALSALVLLPTVASANGSSVAPTRLLLAAGAPSTYVVITNTSPVPQRYSVSAYRWDQTAENPVALSPTSDIVFFPGSFSIDSLRTQRIRIGTTAASGTMEKTFRIVVSELPPLQTILTPQAAGLAFTANFSIPIYLAPQSPISTGSITNVVVDRRHLRFTVRNTGNVHFVAKAMRVLARGDSETVMSAENSAWFVLANSQHDVVMPIPSGTCSAIRTVSIVVDAGTAKFDRTVSPEHLCG
jgi:fimbrial chaperone protein